MKIVIDKDFSIGEYHWNHRVVRRIHHPGTDKEEVEYAVHEAHYKIKGRASGPCSITRDPVAPVGENLGELRSVLEQMQKALDHPVLDYETREEL